MTNFDPALLQWLLDGDPVIRHWVQRDLLRSSEQKIQEARKAITLQGWGKSLLEMQDPEGTWGHGLYSPKWISTFYTCLLLKRLELPLQPAIGRGLEILVRANKAVDGGWGPQKTWNPSDTCVNGMLLGMLAYWGLQSSLQESLVHHLLRVQMDDGGWNCRWHKGDHHSSFHSTLSVLEGMWNYQSNQKESNLQISKALAAGIGFLLDHKLYQSHRTGAIVDQRMTRLSFPTRWRYDILKALDLFQLMQILPDDRMEPAVEVLVRKADKMGKWPLQQNHAGQVFFHLEETGHPSRINTIRALRVLQWWESRTTEVASQKKQV